ncbi:hypothetical protein Tco_0085430 [Tanacetum coccineum]
MDDLKFIGSSLGIDVGLSALILFNALFLLMHDKQSVTGSCLLPSGWLLTLEGLAQLATLLQIFHLTSTRSQCDGNYILFYVVSAGEMVVDCSYVVKFFFVVTRYLALELALLLDSSSLLGYVIGVPLNVEGLEE